MLMPLLLIVEIALSGLSLTESIPRVSLLNEKFETKNFVIFQILGNESISAYGSRFNIMINHGFLRLNLIRLEWEDIKSHWHFSILIGPMIIDKKNPRRSVFIECSSQSFITSKYYVPFLLLPSFVWFDRSSKVDFYHLPILEEKSLPITAKANSLRTMTNRKDRSWVYTAYPLIYRNNTFGKFRDNDFGGRR